MVNIFTVDLEDWFQGLTSTNPQIEHWPSFESRVEPATWKLLAILRAYEVKATFFVLGHVADCHPDLVAQIHAEGHEIGVHGYYHRFVYRLTPREFERELEQGIEAIVRATGERPLGHRAPYFSVNGSTPWAFACMQAQGLRYDSSVFPTRSMLYGYPGAPRFPYRIEGCDLLELPASTIHVAGRLWPMAGGFYMRALPYSVTRWAITQLNRQGRQAMVYIHPWELDLGQHYDRVTPRERITHYYGRSGLEAKLHRLFSDFRFAPVRDVVESLDYDLRIDNCEPGLAPRGSPLDARFAQAQRDQQRP